MSKIKILKNYPLGKLTTFKIGGAAQYFCSPKNLNEIKEALLFSKDNDLAINIIGGGANLLIADSGIKGLIISTKNLKHFTKNNNIITSESGISLDKLNKKLMSLSLSGMEFSSGLPGSLGGAVFMNARAYGKDFSELIKSVSIVNENLELELIDIKDINYSYKNSIFMKRKNIFIYDVTLKLIYGNKKNIKLLYQKNINDRIQKGQFDFPSAGCIFKNDYNVGISTGKIIDELGLKGIRIGGAEIYEKHGNFIINKSNANSGDILQLIELVEKEVFEKKGIKLEREVQLLGFDK